MASERDGIELWRRLWYGFGRRALVRASSDAVIDKYILGNEQLGIILRTRSLWTSNHTKQDGIPGTKYNKSMGAGRIPAGIKALKLPALTPRPDSQTCTQGSALGRFINTLKYTGIHWDTLEYTGIHWEYTGIHWNTLEYTEIPWNTPEYTETPRHK